MTGLFYVSAAVAVVAALMVVTRANAMHALINLVILILAMASIFYTLGGPFLAVLQIVIYAGAILILFVFAIMLLDTGPAATARERGLVASVIWVVPVILAAVLLTQFVFASAIREAAQPVTQIAPKQVGMSLFTTYVIGVELASVLLLAAVVAAYHFGAFLQKARREDD